MTNIKKLMTIFKFIMKHPANKMQVPVLIITAFATLVVFCAYWLPASFAHSDVANKIETEKDMIKLSQDSRVISQAFDRASETVAIIQKKLSSRSSTGDIISKINELAKVNKLALAIDNTDNKEEIQGGYALSVLDISVRGSYQGFKSFINGLEKLDSMIVLRRVKIEREAKQGGTIKAAVKTAIYMKTSSGELK